MPNPKRQDKAKPTAADWDVLCHRCNWKGIDNGQGCPACGAADNMLFERMEKSRPSILSAARVERERKGRR